jgi:beta-aspartyl-peptidase (threonine type)
VRILVLSLIMAVMFPAATTSAQNSDRPLVLVVHGGAGTITRASMTPEREREYRAALEASLRAGFAVLQKGGSSLDAVESAIRLMEDSPLFNAGKGAVFTHDGRNELDSSIMNGATRAAGAVAGVTIIKNPISAARAVMEKSKHVLMAGRGAELFATSVGLEVVDPSYFWTERRWKQLQELLLQEQKAAAPKSSSLDDNRENRFGTVGAVALDAAGNLAAGTSTGGMSNKRFGRIGDSPIIGAGTWADNTSCAVSGTGDGEYFIRLSVARDIAALVEYKGMTVAAASEEVIQRKLTALGGEGGVIVLDRRGNVAMPFNSEGMYRGVIRSGAEPEILIYK